ncbi:serine/threonine-protein kinase [Alcanivorax sp. 1008]|uniref:serine/threonine protein kinase n=1 Tax=Alcanivorax sp. 1008 TaxID=2816853 RepID=UPI001E310015
MQIPGYRLQSKIGRGGMAAVYLAVQESFDRPVAIKVMNPVLAADPTFSQRFIREAKMMAQLSHPHIVPVFDIGTHGDLHYMSMEHIVGGTLKQRLRDGLEDDDIQRITAEIAAALDYTGEQDIIHRDIKPDNIMFRGDGSAVLMDFGIARPMQGDEAMTQLGTIVGTPKYMSPEQHRGKGVDSRADLYSLGVVLFEMLTGRAPYTGEDAMSIGIKHISEPIPLLPSDKKRWQPLVRKLMAKDPEQRFQRGNEVIAALKSLSAAAPAADNQVAAPAPAAAKFVDGNSPEVKLESRMRCKEIKEKAGLLSSVYVFDIYVMADDFNQFQGHFEKISQELFAWGKERGKKCGKVKFKATVHPWIAGRVKEYVRNLRKADTHEFLKRIPIEVNLVGADGQPIEQYRIEPDSA